VIVPETQAATDSSFAEETPPREDFMRIAICSCCRTPSPQAGAYVCDTGAATSKLAATGRPNPRLGV
jgi:hypothetical protein